MIHITNIYKIEYEKYIFLKRIRILLFSMLVIISGVLCMKFFARADGIYHDEVLNYSLREDGTAAVTGLYNISAIVINIPDTIYLDTEYKVTEISPDAFVETDITEIRGQYIKTIGYGGGNSFKSCKKLLAVDLPNPTYIGKNTFDSCKALQNISLPNADYIGDSAFENCESLINAYLPNATYIGAKAFSGDIKFKEIRGQNALFIGLHAFYNCFDLEDINLSNTTYIGESAFKSCLSLQSISSPRAAYIGGSAFEGCINLNSAYFQSAT